MKLRSRLLFCRRGKRKREKYAYCNYMNFIALFAALTCAATLSLPRPALLSRSIPLPCASSSLVQTANDCPAAYGAEEGLFRYLEKQRAFTGYKFCAAGEIEAKKGPFRCTQTVETTTVKSGGEFYSQYLSSSAFIRIAHQSFTKELNGKKTVACRSAETATRLKSAPVKTLPCEEYRKLFGISPEDDTLGGIAVTRGSLRSVSGGQAGNSHYCYRVSLRPDGEDLNALRAQMQRFGGLEALPVFTLLELTLTVCDDWTPVSLETRAEYTVRLSLLGELRCVQTMTARYSEVNAAVEIPDAALFRRALCAK